MGGLKWMAVGVTMNICHDVGGSLKWGSLCGRQYGGSSEKEKIELPYDPAIPLLGICLEKAMFEKDLKIGFLLDFYGDVLSERRRTVLDYYYNDDLSLAEISEHLGITRQGVRDSIKRAEATLLEMEDKLGLAKRFREIQRGLDTIITEAHAIEDDSIRGATIRDITQHTMKIIEVAGHLND